MLEVAREAVVRAGNIVLSLRGKRHTYFSKEKLGDFTTEADIASEREILKTLQSKFPKHNYLTEEAGRIENGSSYCWVIDPIDGTIPYSSGLPTFGVSIGLLKEGEPLLGVVNLPALKSIFWAEKGRGAYLNSSKIVVSEKKDLIKSVVGFELAHVGGRRDEIRQLLMPIVDKVRYPPMLACTVAGVSYVACGVFDAYIHSAYPWDFAAGAAIIEEEGGMITDYQGKSIDWSKDWIDFFASNGRVHEEILSLIKA